MHIAGACLNEESVDLVYRARPFSNFSAEQSLSCPKGGFPSIRHNEIRDLTADLLTEVCNDVHIEPDLQPVEREVLTGSSANGQDGARLDISANGFWCGRFEQTYFDV